MKNIILIGLPGAGKTTAGERAAALLGARFCDIDRVIELAEGRSVADIFREDGEARFRELERAELIRRAAEPGTLISAGGGWAAQPGNLLSVKGLACVIHLRVSPEEAARRLGEPGGRPLLETGTLERLRELAAQRERFYATADDTVDTTGLNTEEVARAIVRVAKTLGGW